VMIGRERASRRFTDGECDLLNGILPILAMGEAIHASAPAAPMAPATASHHGEATGGSARPDTAASSIADSPTRTARSASRFVPR
jgi:hypothetical protein